MVDVPRRLVQVTAPARCGASPSTSPACICAHMHDFVFVYVSMCLCVCACVTSGSSDPGPDISNIIHAYGRKFVHQDSSVALQYYMLAAMAGGNTLAIKGQVGHRGERTHTPKHTHTHV